SGTVVIRPGDTLTAIARRTGVTVSALVRANHLANPNRIVAGRRLKVPASSPPRSLRRMPPKLRQFPERQVLAPRFDHWAKAYGVPPDLLKATTWVESGWQNNVVSPVGARGIGQLMPDTVSFVSKRLLHTRLNPAKPDDNIRMSARFLRYLLD